MAGHKGIAHKKSRKNRRWEIILTASAAALAAIRPATGDTLNWSEPSTTFTSWTTTPDWYDQQLAYDVDVAAGDALEIEYGETVTWSQPSGQDLVLSSTSADGESLSISDGALVIAAGGSAGGSYGVEVESGGSLGLSSSGALNNVGSLAVDTGGTLSTSAVLSNTGLIYIGLSGVGNFTESGGTVTASNGIDMGHYAGSSGGYSLSSGTLTSTYETVGDVGVGVFNQTGGSNQTTDLYLGLSASSANGAYTLSGGNLTASYEYIGGAGGGTFTQNTNTGPSGNTVTQSLTIGASGSYTLSGGTLSVAALSLQSGGTLNWTAGTLNLTNSSLAIGSGGTLGSNFSLNSGQTLDISGPGQSLAINGSGTLNISGGSVSAPSLTVAGSFAQSAGSATFTSLNAANASSFSFTGGSMTISGGNLDPLTPAPDILDGVSGSYSGAWEVSGSSSPVLTLQQGATTTTDETVLVGSSGGTGNLNVTGSGTDLSVNGWMDVGWGGSNSGAVYTPSTGYLTLSQFAQASGILDIGDLGGKGSALIQSAASVTGSGLEVGWDYYGTASTGLIPSTGTVTVTGFGSISTGTVEIGYNEGDGTVIVYNGGSITADGTIYIGESGGTGTLTLGTSGQTDTGSRFNNSSGLTYVGYNGGIGALNVYAGTTLATRGLYTSQSGGSGKINLGGGTINAGTLGLGNITDLNWTAGTLEITSSIINTPTISVPSGGKLIFEPNATATTTLSSLLIAPGGVVDLGNNTIFIDYGSGPDPIASIAQWIANGFYGLSGPQIISSSIATADAASGLSYGIGYADGADGVVAGLPSGEIEIMFTLLGDANLDGTVNAEDYTPFSHNIGLSGMYWDDGDFNYDGTVNAEDYTLFAHNIGQSASLAAGGLEAANGINIANVPEPMSAGMMVMAGLGMLRRRRRLSRQSTPPRNSHRMIFREMGI
jgi:hypothetical protein